MADWCYSEGLDGNIGKAGVWNGGFCKHPKWHKKGLGHSHSGMSGIFFGNVAGLFDDSDSFGCWTASV